MFRQMERLGPGRARACANSTFWDVKTLAMLRGMVLAAGDSFVKGCQRGQCRDSGILRPVCDSS